MIWPWRNWPESQSWLHEQRRRLLAAARLPAERCFGFHGLRKLMCSNAAAIDPLGASLQAGHEDMRTTVSAYIHPQMVMAAMEQLPQPVMPLGGDQ